MKRRAELHEALVIIEKEDKIMKRRLNVGTGRKNRKEVIRRMREIEASTYSPN